MANATVSDPVERVIERVENITTEGTGRRYSGALYVYALWCDENGHDPLHADAITLERYLRHLKADKGYAYGTASIHQAALTKFFDAVEYLANGGRVEADVQDENPTEGTNLYDVYPDKAERRTKKERALDGTEKRHALTESEVEDMVSNVPSPKVRNQLVIRLTYQAMLRRTEVQQLKLSDIDQDERCITVRAEVAKNGESRKTYYMPSLDRLLNLWLTDRESYAVASESDYLFVGENMADKHLSGFQVGEVVAEAAEGAGVQRVLYTDARGTERRAVSTHSLRHSGAVRRWENGADLETLRRLLGHEDLSTTQQYLDVDPDDLADKARQFW